MPTPTPGATAAPPAPSPARPGRLARLGPALAALATLALHAACGGRYGIFRDELYFLSCGERLATGYVDQPPGVAVVAWAARGLFGTWVPGLRLFGWLATAATVYLAGRLAARLAGLGRAQGEDGRSGLAATLAAVATFACLVLRGTSHMLSMNAFEPLLVLALVFVLLRLAEGEDPRLWVAAAGLAGLAILFKYSAAPLVLLLLAGFVATPARRALWTPWALVAAGFGILAVLPNLLWQVAHGLPFLELVRNGVLHKNVLLSPLQFLGNVLFEANPGAAPLWLGGLAWLLAAPPARAARFAGIGCLLQLLALTFGHGKPYYAAPLLPILLAAGGAAAARLVASRLAHGLYAAGLALSALVFAPVALPILSEEAFLAYQRAMGGAAAATPTERLKQSVLPQVYADMHGWHELVEGVAGVYRALPPEEQRRAAIYGSNYGVASAVDVLGPEHGLPRGLATSGHNSWWFWGVPRGRGDPLILVGGPQDGDLGFHERCEVGAQLPPTPYVMPYEDAHTIWVCRGARGPAGALPPQARSFN